MDNRKIIGITMGDPCGCGPEITVKALQREDIYQSCKPLVIADASVMEKAVAVSKTPWLNVHRVSDPTEGYYTFGTIDVYHIPLVDLDSMPIGKVCVMGGEAAFQCVKAVIELAMAGKVDATVTNALNKEAINMAGHHYSGHTEIYAEYTQTPKYSMMLAHNDLRVVHVSTHVSLREACDRVKKERIREVIELAYNACRSLGIEEPKIGVCGLNPHGGENGMFGREEIEEIIPAIEEAQVAGRNVSGPIPPDTAFSKALGGWYDILVCMYHDQGHIPLKVVGFVYDRATSRWKAVEGVNITLGLPIIRVSVDHGTAFGHAWMGVSNELSLLNSIRIAVQFAEHRGTTG